MVYLDSSALVKLVVLEPESRALRAFLRQEPQRISCALAITEVLRAVRHAGAEAIENAHRVLLGVELIRIDDALLHAAASIDAGVVRSLDAIHLAAAQLLTSHLTALVTYDRRMADAAKLLGFAIAAPA
jgi:hypothetical protein